MSLNLYYLFAKLGAPFVKAALSARARAGKEDPARLPERFGKASLPRPPGPLIWLHAASIGEANSVLPLLDETLRAYPGLRALFTTGTVTSAGVLASRLPPNAFHQYFPADVPSWTRAFVAHWRPDAVFFTESELWPCAVAAVAGRAPLVLLNGRMSERSEKRWLRSPSSAREILRPFRHVFAQSPAHAEAFRRLGARDVAFLGNLKYDSPPLPVDQGEEARFARAVKDRPIWLAASIHPGEELPALEAAKRIVAALPGALAVAAPRHPSLGPHVAECAERMGLSAVLRSRGELPGPDTDVYVADTVGEMGLFYRLAHAAFIGGSLVPKGGQNPMEAARLGCAFCFGPHMENFAAVAQECTEAGACLPLLTPEELPEAMLILMNNHELRDALAARAEQWVREKSGVLRAHMEALAPLFEDVMSAYDPEDEMPETGRYPLLPE